MIKNGVITPDVTYDVPEHTSLTPEKVGYFFEEQEALKFAEKVGGSITLFSAKVQIEGKQYAASVKYSMVE